MKKLLRELKLERKRLDAKLGALVKFIDDPDFDNVSPHQQALLRVQQGVMFLYLQVLDARIQHLEVLEEEK